MRTRAQAAVLLLVVLTVTGSPLSAQEPPASRRAFSRVIVLGFVNLGDDTTLAWVGPGTVASVRADLGRDGFQTVGVEVSAVDLERLSRDPAQLAMEMGTASSAAWAVWGSYQRMGPRLRLTARVYELTEGSEIHTVRAERLRDEVFDLQDDLADEILGYLRSSVRASGDGAMTTPAGTTRLAVPIGIIDGPPPPEPPAVIRRDANGRATIRAVRVSALAVDGVLDDPVYQETAPASGFIQQEPQEGLPATEQTEIWILFDDDNVYVSARCWNSAPESEWIVNDMRRDSSGVFRGESVGLLLDTFYDRRNGVNIAINPIGGRMDAQMTDERNVNMDYNPIWNLQTGRFDGGWTFEAAFPFKSLRYRPGRA